MEKSFEQLSVHKPIINRKKSILAPKDSPILRVFTIDLGLGSDTRIKESEERLKEKEPDNQPEEELHQNQEESNVN